MGPTRGCCIPPRTFSSLVREKELILFGNSTSLLFTSHFPLELIFLPNMLVAPPLFIFPYAQMLFNDTAEFVPTPSVGNSAAGAIC